MTKLETIEFDQQRTCGMCKHWQVCIAHLEQQALVIKNKWLLRNADKHLLVFTALANCCGSYRAL